MTARKILADAIDRFPSAASPRVLLAQSLLHDGELAAAERLLRDALAAEPNHPHALRDLEALRRRIPA